MPIEGMDRSIRNVGGLRVDGLKFGNQIIAVARQQKFSKKSIQELEDVRDDLITVISPSKHGNRDWGRKRAWLLLRSVRMHLYISQRFSV